MSHSCTYTHSLLYCHTHTFIFISWFLSYMHIYGRSQQTIKALKHAHNATGFPVSRLMWIKGDFSCVAVSLLNVFFDLLTGSYLISPCCCTSCKTTDPSKCHPKRPQEYVLEVFSSRPCWLDRSVKQDHFHAAGGFLPSFRGNVSAAGILADRQYVNTDTVPKTLCFTFKSFSWLIHTDIKWARSRLLKSKAWKPLFLNQLLMVINVQLLVPC